MKLITVATHFNLAEAELERARLEAAGFHAAITNESTSAWFGGTSTAARVRIEVPENEAEDAQEFLAPPAE